MLNPTIVQLWKDCQQEGATLFPEHPDVAQSAAATLMIAHQKAGLATATAAPPRAPAPVATPRIATPPPAAQPAPQGDGTQAEGAVVSVEPYQGISKKNGKPFTSYTITFDSGVKAKTFNKEHAKLAEESAQQGSRVSYTYKANTNPKWAADLVSLEVVPF